MKFLKIIIQASAIIKSIIKALEVLSSDLSENPRVKYSENEK